jgi:hypothetical protein
MLARGASAGARKCSTSAKATPVIGPSSTSGATMPLPEPGDEGHGPHWRAARLQPDPDPTGRGRSACHVGGGRGLVEVRAVARGRAALPVVRTRRISLIAVDELTARRRAASQIGLPRSTARTIRSRRSKETGAGMTSNHGRRFPRNRERLQPPGVWASDGRRRYRGQRAPRPAKTTPRVLERM